MSQHAVVQSSITTPRGTPMGGVVGMVVDGVSDVITLTPEQLHPAPEFSSAIGSDHVLAIGSVHERMLILLDIEKLMSSAGMGLLNSISH